jgi:hypothetical protein
MNHNQRHQMTSLKSVRATHNQVNRNRSRDTRLLESPTTLPKSRRATQKHVNFHRSRDITLLKSHVTLPKSLRLTHNYADQSRSRDSTLLKSQLLQLCQCVRHYLSNESSLILDEKDNLTPYLESGSFFKKSLLATTV